MSTLNNYICPVEIDGDDLVLTFPDELMTSMNWKIGDILVWSENDDGSWTVQKKTDTI